MRLGTRKSRAPSGVERVRIGVSTSRKSRSSRTSRIVLDDRGGAAPSRRCIALAAQVQRAVLAGAASRRPRGRPRRSGTAASRRRASRVDRRRRSARSRRSARFGLTLPASRATSSPPRGQHVLGAQALGQRRSRRARVEDELDDARAVAQVDEDQAAVVAAAVDPAGDADLAADVARRAGRRPRRRGSRWRAASRITGAAPRLRSTAATMPSASSPVGTSWRVSVSWSTEPSSRSDGHEARAGARGLLELALDRAPGELHLRRPARRGARGPPR